MTGGPHIFDNMQAEMEQEAFENEHEHIEYERLTCTHDRPVHVLTLDNSEGEAMLVRASFNPTRVAVRKVATATGEILPVEVVEQGDDTVVR